MAEHTPTPWKLQSFAEKRAFASELEKEIGEPIETSDWIDIEANDSTLGSAYMHSEEQNEINAGRIVACVNAFHSPDGRELPTEKIEPGLFWEMRDRLELARALFAGLADKEYALPATEMQADAIAALLAKLEPRG